MINNIINIHYLPLADELSEWQSLSLIPASTTYKCEDKATDDGRVAEFNITAKLQELPDDLRGELLVILEFEDNSNISLGTPYFPFRFDIKEGSVISISAKYVIPSRALSVL